MKKFYYEINNTKNGFDYWINKDYIPVNLKKKLKNSNLLFVPQSYIRDKEYLTFPVNTEELFQFIKENSSKEVKPNICISSSDYKEVALHGYEIYLGSFVVSNIVVPIFISLISKYLERKIYKSNDNPTVNINVTIVNNDKNAKEFKIKEPYSKFIEIQEDILTYNKKGIINNQRNSGAKIDEHS